MLEMSIPTDVAKEASTMDGNATETRRYHYEQIKAREIARGATEEDASRIAAETVDKVMADKRED